MSSSTILSTDSRPGCIRVEYPLLRNGGLLVEIRVVRVVYDHDNLSLRRIRRGKAEKETVTDPELIHALL